MVRCKVVLVSVAVCLCMSFSVFAQENASKNDAVGLWHFDEGEGETTKDSSGNGNDLKLFNTSWVEGKKGKCLSFDGEKSCAFAKAISDSLVFLGDEFTISVWIKPDYVYPKTMFIVNCGTTWKGPGYTFMITYGSLRFRSGKGYNDWWSIATPYFRHGKIPEKVVRKDDLRHIESKIDNRWYYVAVTYKDGVYKIYVDGSLACEKKERAIIPATAKTLVIGKFGAKDCFFKGLIDELEILSRAKTGEEIIEDALMGLI